MRLMSRNFLRAVALVVAGIFGLGTAQALVPLGGSTPTGVFPLAISNNARTLVQNDGTAFPVLGRALWSILTLNQTDYQTVINDTAAKNFNSIEISFLVHWPNVTAAPFANNGALLPFDKTLSGATWTGSLTYANPATDAPDFTTPDSAYWTFVDGLIDYCASHGINIFAFPGYAGFQSGNQGWMVEMVANGTTKVQAYGAFIQARYGSRKNIVWMAGGDTGTGSNPFSGPQSAAEAALLNGLTSVKLFTAEWDTPSNAKDQTTFGPLMSLNFCYTFAGLVNAQCVSAYAQSPTAPVALLEEPYDQEGPDGTNVNPAATQPCARFPIWGALSTSGGYIAGNGFIWPFNSGYATHLTTQAQTDESNFNAFVISVRSAWMRLVPSGQGSIGTLITSGAGTQDATSMATAACTPLGDLWVAYLGPGTAGSVTVDLTKMRGTTTWRWYDVTNGTFTAIGTTGNTGTHVFTTPGNNSAGRADWILTGAA